jgi:Mg2+ and Co2+ transporter CorA
MTLDTKTAGSASLSFDLVQDLRDLNDMVLSSRASCSGNLDLVTTLEERCRDDIHGLQPIRSELRGYVESLDVLRGRVQNATDLVRLAVYALEQQRKRADLAPIQIGHALDYLNQEQASEVNRSVAIITFVSAVYLPASFIGVGPLIHRPVWNALTHKNRPSSA